MERMIDYKTIHEAFWEAIRVEQILKRSHLVEVPPQEEKSSHVTDHVEEPVPSDMQTDQPELDTKDSISTVGLEISPMSTNNSEVQISGDEAQVIDFPHINSPIDFVFGDQLCQRGDVQRLVRDSDLMVHVLQVRTSTHFSAIKSNYARSCAKKS